jgi:hypothetical protein
MPKARTPFAMTGTTSARTKHQQSPPGRAEHLQRVERAEGQRRDQEAQPAQASATKKTPAGVSMIRSST